MALSFAVGSACFLIGPFPGYADLVGPQADAVTFFVGSLFFTAGGTLQSLIARPDRHRDRAGRNTWWTAATQSVGTLCFNVSTGYALVTTISDPQYDRLVWRPDAVGSVCFLVSGVIGYFGVPRESWQPAVNLLGCVFFGVSAVAGYVVPSTGSVLDLAAANFATCLGAACFLACAVAGLRARTAARQPLTEPAA